MAIITADSAELVSKVSSLTKVGLASASNEQVVEGFGGEDKISIDGGRTISSAAVRGDDVVLTLNDGYNIRIKNAKGRYLNVVDADGEHYKPYGGEYTYKQVDVIKNFMGALDNTTLSGSKALDEAIKACSSKFSTIKEAVAKCVEDCKNAGNAQTFLRKYCGIELSDFDTGAITGWDAANSDIKDGEDIIPEDGDVQTFEGTSFTVNGLKLTIPTKLTDVQQKIINGLYTWWTKEGLDLISASYGNNFGFDSESSATVKEMDVEFVTKKQNFLALVSYAYDSKSGKTAKLTMQINMQYYNNLTDEVNGASSTSGAGYLDRTLAHEFTHAVMAANINFFGKLPNFIAEGMAELTHGIDDQRYSDILSLAGSSSKLSSNLNVSDTKSSKSSIYAAGYIFLRYLAKQSAIFEKDYEEVYDPSNPTYAGEDDDEVTYSDSKKTKLIISDFLGVVDASNFNSKLVTLDAASDDQFVVLLGNKNANVLRAGSEGSSMDGGLGADKLYGGSGADTYSYSVGGGADQFFNFDGAKGDIVQIFGDNSITKASFKESGKNIILTVGTGKQKSTITFISPSGIITIVDENGDTLATYNEPLADGLTSDTKKTKLTAKAPFEGTIDLADYASTFKDVDASSATAVVNIIGNSQANVLKASSVGSYLDGGVGADKLYGGAGSDTYSYSVGGGADTLFNFNGASGDIVQIFGDNSITKANFKESGKNIILTVGTGKQKSTVTFSNPTGQITVVDENGETLATYNEPLPEGLTSDTKKTKLTAKAPFEGTIDLTDYVSTFKEVDASSATAVVNIIGNSQANVLKASSVGSYLDGGVGADKLYGGAGVDTYSYSVGGGADTLFNFNGASGDVVQIFGDNSITKASFKESGKNITMTVGTGKQKSTVTFNNPNGIITIVDENGDTLTTYNEPLPEGLTSDTKKTKLTAKAPFEGTLNLADYVSTFKDVDASSATAVVNIVGNANANVLKASSVGSYLDGGVGADKLYGGAGVDTFAYSAGGGADQFFNYGKGDVIELLGISSFDKSNVKESGNKITLTVGSGKTKSTITLTDVNNAVNIFYGASEDALQSFTYGIDLADGVGYNKTKTQVTIGGGAALDDGAEIDLSDYSSTVKEINASKFGARLSIVGNANANNITIGSGGGTLYGGHSTKAVADKLYGGSGADVFKYATGDGNDTVFNYDYAQSDVIDVDGTVKSSSVSGKNVVLKIGSGSLTLGNVVNKLVRINIDGTDGIYKFDSKNTTLQKAAENAAKDLISIDPIEQNPTLVSGAQFPTAADDYWFEEQDSALHDELGEIISTDAPIDLNFDQLSTVQKKSAIIDLASSARHQKLKNF